MASSLSDSTPSPGEQDITNREIMLTKEDVLYIEKMFASYEKIAMAFLFHDDVKLSLNVCLNSIENRNSCILYNYVRDVPPVEWSFKLLECLYRVKNYFGLQKFGLSKFDAMHRFNATSSLDKNRVALYHICEALNEEQTNEVMNSVPAVPKQQYLEIWFLKILLLPDCEKWRNIYSVLNKLGNAELSNLVDELNNSTKDEVQELPTLEMACGTDVTIQNNMYPIKDPQHVGLCLIINNQKFKEQTERTGTEKDVESLGKTLSKFNFKLCEIKNIRGQNFVKSIKNAVNQYFKDNYSIFMIVLLSHGGNGFIIASDEVRISIEEDILGTLADMDILKNIPKLIIIQACQGEKFLADSIVELDSCNQADDDNNHHTQRKPPIGKYIRDAFIALSTVPGFKSYRNPETGSYFIQNFCKCLNSYPYCDIQEIMTKVTAIVSENLIETKLKDLYICQYPQYTSLLRKKLFLKLKLQQ